MSITLEGIKDVNQRIKKIQIKGKQYATVAARVQAFRELCPDGTINTEIVDRQDGVVLMQARVLDENGKLLATGYAQEKEAASMINKTSFIENCETSAIGRALAMIGLGSEENIASSQEVAAAISQQETQQEAAEPDHSQEPITDIECATLEALTKKAFPNTEIEKIFPTWPKLNKAQYAQAMTTIKERLNGSNSKDH